MNMCLMSMCDGHIIANNSLVGGLHGWAKVKQSFKRWFAESGRRNWTFIVKDGSNVD